MLKVPYYLNQTLAKLCRANVWCFYFGIVFCSCSTNSENEIWPHHNFSKGTITVDGYGDFKNRWQFKSFLIGGDEYLAILDDGHINAFKIGSKALSVSSSIFIGRDKVDYFISPDSVLFILDKTFIVCIPISDTGLSSPVDTIWFMQHLGEGYFAATYYQYPFYVSDSFYHFNISGGISGGSSEMLDKYYSLPIEIAVRRSDPSNSYLLGKFPPEYQKRKYYVFNPSRCVNASGAVIHSFETEPDLHVNTIGSEDIRYVLAQSFFFTRNPEFDVERIFDFNYIARYLTENSRYQRVLYDRFNGRYYRIVKHRVDYEKDDGTINEWYAAPWSVVILDSAFTIEGEVLFPHNEYLFNNVLVTSLGLLVEKRLPKEETLHSDLVYEIFKF